MYTEHDWAMGCKSGYDDVRVRLGHSEMFDPGGVHKSEYSTLATLHVIIT